MELTYFCQRTLIHSTPHGSSTSYLKTSEAGGYRGVSRWKNANLFESLTEAQEATALFIEQSKGLIETDTFKALGMRKLVFHLVCVKGSSFAAAQAEILSTTFINISFDEKGAVSFDTVVS